MAPRNNDDEKEKRREDMKEKRKNFFFDSDEACSSTNDERSPASARPLLDTAVSGSALGEAVLLSTTALLYKT